MIESTQFYQFQMIYCIAVVLFLSNPPAVNHIARGDELYNSFNNKDALSEYELAYKKSPNDYFALLRLVRIYNDNGRINLRNGTSAEADYRQAIKYADSLLHYYPDSAESYFWIALTKGSLIPFVGVREKIQIGKEVKKHIQNSIERDSTFPYSYIIKAIFEREAAKLNWLEKGIVKIIFNENIIGSLKESELNLKTALKYDPNNSYAYYELYWTYKEMGDTIKANNSLRRMLEIRPKSLREKCQQEEACTYLLTKE